MYLYACILYAWLLRPGLPAAAPPPHKLNPPMCFPYQSLTTLKFTGCAVLLTQRDFYDLAWAYFQRAAADNVKHVELFFDPQVCGGSEVWGCGGAHVCTCNTQSQTYHSHY